MKKLVLALAMLGMGGHVYAQTCASPLPLASNTPVNGNTCSGQIGINFGGAIYPHPSIVYSFVWQPTTGGAEPDQILLVGADREMALSTSCTAAPIAAGAPGLPINLDASGLVAGTTYVLAVSTDPGLPVTVPPRCGDFQVSPDTLPVELQNFSVD